MAERRGGRGVGVVEVGVGDLCLTFLLLNTTCPVLTNSVDPDQLASEKPTDLDLHCLSLNM